MPALDPLVPADEATLTLIGYWLGPDSPGCPDVRESVDPYWDADERQAVIAHLSKGRWFRHFLGLSICRFCSCFNGASEQSDGTYYWPEGLAHYLEKHDVSLPRRFIEHVLRGRKVRPQVKARDLEKAQVYDTWWLGRTWREGPGPVGMGGYDSLTDYLEMLRQELAQARVLDYGDAFRDGIIHKLGKSGEYLVLAVDEAQREHEARYGPQAPPVPRVDPEAAIRIDIRTDRRTSGR